MHAFIWLSRVEFEFLCELWSSKFYSILFWQRCVLNPFKNCFLKPQSFLKCIFLNVFHFQQLCFLWIKVGEIFISIPFSPLFPCLSLSLPFLPLLLLLLPTSPPPLPSLVAFLNKLLTFWSIECKDHRWIQQTKTKRNFTHWMKLGWWRGGHIVKHLCDTNDSVLAQWPFPKHPCSDEFLQKH